MIQIDHLTFRYGSTPPIFDGFNWQAGRGEAWALLGPSGCGKSTLLYLLAGLRHPSAGTITINGQPLDRARPETGLILQDGGLLPWATARANVRLGLRIRRFYGPDGKHAPRTDRLPPAEEEDRVEAWLNRLGIVDVANQYPGQLSGGQRQRVAIGRTLALNPDLLLMDEPFSALDAPTREDLQNLIAELRREVGLTTVIVTHSIEEAAFLGERILVLRQPPNREAVIVENPGAGEKGYRATAAFAERMVQLRGLLEENPA